MTATLVEIGELARTRPTADATVSEVAAWYERKAIVLRHVAVASDAPSERDTYTRLADTAHAHACELRETSRAPRGFRRPAGDASPARVARPGRAAPRRGVLRHHDTLRGEGAGR
jgi:hypothetical protein